MDKVVELKEVKNRGRKGRSGKSFDKRKRSGVDRRSPGDRRGAYSLDYFLNGGRERRKGGERRSKAERRAGWVRMSKWVSVAIG